MPQTWLCVNAAGSTDEKLKDFFKNVSTSGSSLVAQWVKDPVLSLKQLGSPWVWSLARELPDAVGTPGGEKLELSNPLYLFTMHPLQVTWNGSFLPYDGINTRCSLYLGSIVWTCKNFLSSNKCYSHDQSEYISKMLPQFSLILEKRNLSKYSDITICSFLASTSYPKKKRKSWWWLTFVQCTQSLTYMVLFSPRVILF